MALTQPRNSSISSRGRSSSSNNKTSSSSTSSNSSNRSSSINSSSSSWSNISSMSNISSRSSSSSSSSSSNRAAPASSALLLLLLLTLSMPSSATGADKEGRSRKILLKRKGCREGLLQQGQQESSKDIPLDSFLTLSITPMTQILKELSVSVYLLDVYQRAVYKLELNEQPGVGCWLTLRHLHSSELLVKVLWPEGVLRFFETTLLTVLFKDGVLRVTAVKSKDARAGPALGRTQVSSHASFRSSPSQYDDGGPCLLLTSLRSVHQSWEEPVAVWLQLTTTPATLHYSVNCAHDDLEWAWMATLGVREKMPWLPWLLAAVLTLLAVAVMTAEWRCQCCRRVLLAMKSCWQRREKAVDDNSKLSSLPDSSAASSSRSSASSSPSSAKNLVPKTSSSRQDEDVSMHAPRPTLHVPAEGVTIQDRSYSNYGYHGLA